MSQTHTGRLQTLASPRRAETMLEAGLERVASAVAELLAHARKIDPRTDEYGHARSRAYTDAVALLKASAKVGHTIAELRGSKFEHIINVRREDVSAPGSASADVASPPGLGFQGRIRLTDERVCVRAANNRWRILDEEDDHDGRGEGNAPTPISKGSNGNFADPCRVKP